jgi:ApaG protein
MDVIRHRLAAGSVGRHHGFGIIGGLQANCQNRLQKHQSPSQPGPAPARAIVPNCVKTAVLRTIGSRRTFRYDDDMYRAVTRHIEVTVEPNFLPERSSAEKCEFFWSYTIVITNTGEETVQLRTRHWIITDASGRQQEVRGEGVVGEQPVLGPGERFEYTSGVPLSTASGFMTGRYQMVSASGERFEIDVPTFSLDSPHHRRVLN